MRLLGAILRSGEGAAGLLLLGLLIAVALIGPLLYPGDPLALTGSALVPPFTEIAHPLGTDRLGRDLLAGLIYGTRTSLFVAISAGIAALGIGTIVGTVAGFLGGIADEVLMRITEAFQTIPAFLLALAFVSVAGPTAPNIVLAIAMGAWTSAARIARAEVLSLRERDFVAAARTLGMHPIEIAFREILPNALTPIISLAAVTVAAAILIEAALSFLGFGDPNRVTWGSMIAEGRTMLQGAPYLSIVPGMALVIAVIAVHLTGRGFADALGLKVSQA